MERKPREKKNLVECVFKNFPDRPNEMTFGNGELD